ncbi:hypothetical protein O6H91_02G106000 [Diphasiastrum complanatum]|uniref:Uncharacterized protein n=7 Tax=Diphasiastrum complanatum TaxID=34168 RepID=A0ACC2EJB8_DIPCM|nr:hypothetical protein O6H91_02G106000 [Diphasiastrum complanatum]KAJ7566494.1 hypothetical protein O6H91_02G106000 [Diphasiastrum complanatum]KAJ7566495.1 hypothetical protein O6H91_02G106000 [Diphasiastrum complanatum]KAJ7566496.1 hypothetical protein O6H91_02G106000 [Diphasiastrum complanatum]KAJ7566497.1 hypothetical protein O6H91_02G106000 [Diphasiastrum complanatum]
MERDDEEFEQLLGEIPRATSAPPHLEEFQRVSGSQLANNMIESGRNGSSPKLIADIRSDEHYDNFYRSYSGVKNRAPHLDNGSIYPDLPSLSPKLPVSKLSSFHSGLALESPRSSVQRLRPLLEMQQNQEARQQGHEQVQQLEISNHQGDLPDSDLLGDSILTNQLFGDGHTLSSAFGVLNIKDHRQSIHNNGVQKGKGDERVVNGIVHHELINDAIESERISGIADRYSHLDSFASASACFGSVAGGDIDSLIIKPESLDILAINSSPVQSLKQGVFTGPQHLTSDLSLQAIENMLRRGSPVQQAFSAGYSSEVDDLVTGFAYYQKQLHQVDAFSATAAAMQAAPFPPNGSCHITELYPSSLQQQISHDVEISNLQAQQRFQQAATLQQSQQLQVLRQIQERAVNRQQMQQQLYTQHQKQLQEQQLHARLYGQSQPELGAFVSNTSQGFLLERGHQAEPSTLGFSTGQHPLLHNNQQHLGSIKDMGWIEQQPQETTLSFLDYAHSSQFGKICHLNAQGSCSRGSGCTFLHPPLQAGVYFGGSKDSRMSTPFLGEGKSMLYGDKHLLRRSSRGTNVTAAVTATVSGMRKKGPANGHSKLLENVNGDQISGTFSIKMLDHMSQDFSELPLQRNVTTACSIHNQQQQFKYTSLQEVEGRIFAIAKDQHGCRFLQRKFDEGDPEEMQKIFLEIIDHIIELMTDPFGNYLIQKLLEVCDEAQHMKILHAVTVKGELIAISLNMHGTRAVQKLIETLKSPDQITLVISALRQGVVTLIKDLNGNHVVQRCLQRLNNDDNEFIFDAAASNCVEIATHRHGCCVLQRCVDFALGTQHQRLVAEVAANALVLSQDQYGNYVVQYILDLGIPWASMEVMIRLEGNYALLSMQKFSSNVVEKCLKQAGDEYRTRIVNELMSSSVLGQLLQDPYANYVVQCALTVTKGALHANLIEAIRPHSPTLRSSPFGKRILSRTNLKR